LVPYLIDGHNLIGQMPGLDLDDPHDEAKLVERLRSYMLRKRKRCTVVFDGGLPGGLSRDLSTASVRVVFAHGGTTADAIILERIRNARDPASLTVISADREIIDVAVRRRCRVLSPSAFAAELNAPSVPDDRDPNSHLTPDEVEEWLRLFHADDD
jgi:predicted RNA-binding protein with PIN domain